ncbi:S ribosomal protein L37%2C mitochondrial isoform X1 [Xyrichtys novacula]|uniref:Large ribosomal subunit protein mL37 n=1 Tax=Xyrichtys novacula TaxID=13765 RepID=A0AAV1GCX0_XYRNO|nr:S ribosomal protein L37%2C mitochondrial isoform X1 [Xyrichtys novacula]
MFPGVTRCLRTSGWSFARIILHKDLTRLSAHGGARFRIACRSFVSGRCLLGKVASANKPRERVEIPGLEVVTYKEKMHYVPGLSKPPNLQWERDSGDPMHYRVPPVTDMPLYETKPCYVYHQRTSALEGVRQALWLTKTKLISGLPPQLLSHAEDPINQIPDQDNRVKNAIKHARFWDTTNERPPKEKYSNTLLRNLLHLCATLQSNHPEIERRILAEKYSLAASWKRGDDLFQIRGQNGLLLNCMDPLPEVSAKGEVNDTADHVLETFYPVSPTIDLQEVYVYKKELYSSGFRDDYPYQHAHTLYFSERGSDSCRLRPEQLRAKMVMFSFGNALARAHKQYGPQPQHLLEKPITVQAVGTNGRVFQFLVFQLNTTDLSGDDGIKNQLWLDKDAELYEFAKVRPLIKKKEVKVPAGLKGYKPETFRKFLALYLHGAVSD